ncbi:hypothetical protein, partial [Vibrio anguillarum]|uniref:hypothetical protein n=1 Tax=Vibrio anguillarum TaxID=55601 RepID=UPI001BE43796
SGQHDFITTIERNRHDRVSGNQHYSSSTNRNKTKNCEPNNKDSKSEQGIATGLFGTPKEQQKN